jgi:secondary thiamine-phosphate synthase enzyme
MNTIDVKTKKREEFVDITSEVQKAVDESSVKNGFCVVFCPHTTAGLTINENADPDVQKDIMKHLRELIPEDGGFAHSEGNSDAHIKASLVGSSVTVLVEGGNLVLGTWQGIYFCEFDGPRQRRVHVGII